MFIYFIIIFIFMFWIIEILIALIITYFFIVRERPKVRFLLYGYLFFVLASVLRLPVEFLKSYFSDFFSTNLIPLFILSISIIIILEIAKYLSLKRFLKTKSYKNGILFGIGFATFESINFFKVLVITYVFSFLSLNLDTSITLGPNLEILSFLFFFILNVATTVLIIISIIKKNLWYLFYAIILMIVSLFGFNFLNESYKLFAQMVVIFYCLFVIFHYRKIK